MTVTIDGVGRVVIPKAVRDALGLTAETELDVIVDGNSVRLEPIRHHERTVEIVDGLPRFVAVDGVSLTDEDVRAIRLSLRR